jgi:hypothetical protein
MKLNDQEIFNFIKCTEELSQLSALLIHQVCHPDKKLDSRITEEVAAVLYWVWTITEERLDEGEIKKHIEKRRKQHEEQEEIH